jgi:chromosome segregation ATPase
MAEPHSQVLTSQRPASPTELSYTQLVKLTPSHHNRGGFRQGQGPAVNASRTNLPSSMSNGIGRNSADPVLTAAAMSGVVDDRQIFANSPFHSSKEPHKLNTDPSCPAMTPYPYPHPPHIHNTQNLQQSSIDRVASLAQKLHSQAIHSQSKQNDIQQFITMLQGMQHTVSRTADEQQRNRKSQALNLLLNMFERLLEERNELIVENTSQDEVDRLKERVGQLEEDNKRLHTLCNERDDKLIQLHRELQQLGNENDELKKNLSRAQNDCNEERKRAQEAELIASESESVRDGLFASYGQLTEANVELESLNRDLDAEKQALSRDLEYCKEEVSQLETQCNILYEQLKDKDLEVAESEKKLDEMHTQIASHLQSLELANTERHRLQNELHSSQRNATSISHQLLEIREQYTKLRKESDASRRNQQSDESENSNLKVQLQEEQLKRKDLEVQMSKFQSREIAAQDQLRKLARANAELKTKVNEMSARLENRVSGREKASDACSVMSDLSMQRNNFGQGGAPSLLDYVKPDSI